MTESTSAGGGRRFPSPKTILDLLATVALTVAALVVIWSQLGAKGPTETRPGGVPLPTTPLPMDGVALKGSAQATVGIIEFSDFQCPFCGRFAREVLPEIDRDYIQPGKVRFVFRHLPLDRHPVALPAALAAECAGREGKFWELHDRLFAADPQTLTVEMISTMAQDSKIPMSDFQDCLAGDASARVNRDLELARLVGVGSTPTFFVGRILPSGELDVAAAIPGALPIAEFRREIDRLLEPRSLWTTLRGLF